METTEFFTQLVNFLLAQDPKELKNRIFWKEILVKSNLKEKMREIKKRLLG